MAARKNREPLLGGQSISELLGQSARVTVERLMVELDGAGVEAIVILRDRDTGDTGHAGNIPRDVAVETLRKCADRLEAGFDKRSTPGGVS